jgi:hypothetical protein
MLGQLFQTADPRSSTAFTSSLDQGGKLALAAPAGAPGQFQAPTLGSAHDREVSGGR